MKLHPSFYAALMVLSLMAALVVAMLAFLALINALVGGVVVASLTTIGFLASVGVDRAEAWAQHNSYKHALGHTVRG